MSKRILTEYEINSIIREYKEDTIGVESLATKYKVGKIKIRTIMESNNIPIKGKGAQLTIGNSNEIEQSKIQIYEASSENKQLLVVCKQTGKEYDDVNNLSGVLTRHILDVYGNVPIPTNTYQRKKYELATGKKWFEEYFNIVEVDKKETKKCLLCDWETVDVNNLSGQLELHINNVHGLNINDYLDRFPSELDYFKKHKRRLVKEIEMSDSNNFVKCEICGEKMRFVNDKHLKSHNISLLDYKLMFPQSKIISETYRDSLRVRYEDNLKYYEHKFTSKPHKEIIDFLKEFGLKIKNNDRKLLNGLEIDILIDELKLGIEYNGLFYHTEKMGKDKNYHLNKTKLMNKKGYKLIHIFEDEWVSNKELIKNKIIHLAGLNKSKTIGARKCKIVELTSEEKNNFLDKFHIQGRDTSRIHIGAKYSGELVAVMTFDNKRNMVLVKDDNKDLNQYELTRFATNINYKLPGIADKLLKEFILRYKPNIIISFGDARWVLDCRNNMYTKLGFKLVKVLAPDYKYYNPKFNRYKRLHKFGFGKNNLKKRYPNIDLTKTERELTEELGYERVWDCGLYKYELILNKD
jgi:very-short-patch-repair endonuclease